MLRLQALRMVPSQGGSSNITRYPRNSNANACFPSSAPQYLVDIHTLCPQIRPRQIYLLHEFCVCLWYIIECEDAISESEEKVGTEGDEGPERQLG
jgi:hypothetical protein